MLGICSTCVRLQSTVTSSGTTVNNWMNFFKKICLICLYFIFMYLYLCIYMFCGCWFCFYFLLAYLLLCAFKFVFSFWHAGFISFWLGLALIFPWSEKKISYLEVVNKFLSVGMQLELAVIKELFIILYINIYIYIFD